MKPFYTLLILFVAFTASYAQTGWEFTLQYAPKGTVGLAPTDHIAAHQATQFSQSAGMGVHYRLHRHLSLGLGLEWTQLQFRKSEAVAAGLFQHRSLHYARIPLHLSTDWHLFGPIYGYGRLNVHLSGLVGLVEPTPPNGSMVFRGETSYNRLVLGTGVELGTRIALDDAWSLLIAVQMETNLTPLYQSRPIDPDQPILGGLYVIDLYPPAYFSLGGTLGLSYRLGAS